MPLGKDYILANNYKIMKRKTKKKTQSCGHMDNAPSCIYGLGFIGALIYFISTATGFWTGVLGVLKAIIWPVMLVYHLFQYLAI